jgi:hypothetical protein
MYKWFRMFKNWLNIKHMHHLYILLQHVPKIDCGPKDGVAYAETRCSLK